MFSEISWFCSSPPLLSGPSPSLVLFRGCSIVVSVPSHVRTRPRRELWLVFKVSWRHFSPLRLYKGLLSLTHYQCVQNPSQFQLVFLNWPSKLSSDCLPAIFRFSHSFDVPLLPSSSYVDNNTQVLELLVVCPQTTSIWESVEKHGQLTFL